MYIYINIFLYAYICRRRYVWVYVCMSMTINIVLFITINSDRNTQFNMCSAYFHLIFNPRLTPAWPLTIHGSFHFLLRRLICNQSNCLYSAQWGTIFSVSDSVVYRHVPFNLHSFSSVARGIFNNSLRLQRRQQLEKIYCCMSRFFRCACVWDLLYMFMG